MRRPGPGLKGIDYAHYAGIIVGGKKDVNASQEPVMPAFGDNRNVMCYLPDIYTYPRARADGAHGRNWPSEHEPKPAAFEKTEDACMKWFPAPGGPTMRPYQHGSPGLAQ